MAKKLQKFVVYSQMGDQHGESSKHTPVKPTQAEDLTQEIYTLLAANDAVKLEKLLRQSFIYPNLVMAWYPDFGDRRSGEWWSETIEAYYTRPVVEALFFDNNRLFHEILSQSQVRKKDTIFYQALVNSLKGTDLSNEILFSWDDTIQGKVSSTIQELYDYGQILEDNGCIKGLKVKTIATQLSKNLASFKCLEAGEKYQNRLSILAFKLECTSVLHSEDISLVLHRGYKRLAINLLTLIFTAGIANCILKMATGNWLFFNKTTSQEKTEEIQAALGFKNDIIMDSSQIIP